MMATTTQVMKKLATNDFAPPGMAATKQTAPAVAKTAILDCNVARQQEKLSAQSNKIKQLTTITPRGSEIINTLIQAEQVLQKNYAVLKTKSRSISQKNLDRVNNIKGEDGATTNEFKRQEENIGAFAQQISKFNLTLDASETKLINLRSEAKTGISTGTQGITPTDLRRPT